MYSKNIHMDVNNIQFTKIEIQIAKHLFKHFKDKYNSRQLAKVLSINHAHANKLCNSLVKKAVLVKEEVGNSVYFSFNYESKIAIKFIEYLLALEELAAPKWLAVVLHSVKKFNNYIVFSLIFGSSAKSSGFNDIDVLLVYDKKNINDINKIKDEIRNSQLIEQPIRYIDVTEKDIYANKDDKIFYNVISDCLVSYNAERYVEVIKKCHKLKNI
jgi:hypothetical protein